MKSMQETDMQQVVGGDWRGTIDEICDWTSVSATAAAYLRLHINALPVAAAFCAGWLLANKV